VSAAIVWAVVGLIVTALPLRSAALVVGAAYSVYYGFMEASSRNGLPVPSTGWQVPQSFVRHGSWRRRVITWGSILGPGFLTRNPYAGFALLPVVIASVGNLRTGIVLAVAIGALHGAGRAIALLRDTREIDTANYLNSVLRSMYWRIFDGYTLLVMSGVILAICARVL
jgi:hypothetical protein